MGGGGQEMKEKENTTGFYLLIDNMVALKKAVWFFGIALKKADWYSCRVASIKTDRRSSCPLLSRSGKPGLWAVAKHIRLGQ